MSGFISGFDKIFRKYTPDPFVIAALLALFVFVLGVIATPTTVSQMVIYWGDGFWKIIAFTLQMIMILVGGYVIAISTPIKALLNKIVGRVQSPGQAVIVTTLMALLASLLNWGLGLVVGAFVAKAMAEKVKGANFRVLVASAYSGFVVWHGGFSGSIPLTVNTPGNFSEKWLGKTLPLSETLFSSTNLFIVMGILILLPMLNYFVDRKCSGDSVKGITLEPTDQEPLENAEWNDLTPAEKLETHCGVSGALFAMGVGYIGLLVLENKFQLGLNQVNFIFFYLGLILHKNPKSFIKAVEEASQKVGPLLIQYPLYAGIMAMMVQSGLAAQFSTFFVDISTPSTFPLWTFLSAGLVNLFVPSGGGQWAVQAPIVIPAAQELGVDLGRAVMAVAWGDAWTNLLQPFWALPVLAIAGLKAKDIMGYCLIALMVTGAIIAVGIVFI